MRVQRSLLLIAASLLLAAVCGVPVLHRSRGHANAGGANGVIPHHKADSTQQSSSTQTVPESAELSSLQRAAILLQLEALHGFPSRRQSALQPRNNAASDNSPGVLIAKEENVKPSLGGGSSGVTRLAVILRAFHDFT